MKNLKFLLFASLLVPSVVHSQPRGTGMKFDLALSGKAEKADFSGLGFTAEMPASVSFKSYAPTPNDQAQTSTCVGWSTTYGALTIEYAKQQGLMNKSLITAKAFCPFFTYNQLHNPDDYTCQANTHLYSALVALRTYGSKRFYLPLFECGSKIDETALRNSKPFRIKSFKRLVDYPADATFDDFFKLDIDKVTPVKQALAAGHVVPFGMQVPNSFFNVTGTDLWEPTYTELSQIPNLTTYGHAMCVVGYDDNKYGGAFEVLNSWGEEWGNAGFYWIKYADFKKFVVDAYYIELFNEIPAATTGCVSGDCKSNYSRMIFASGDEYEGNFKDGVYDGYGIYTWADGSVYAGQWKDGKRSGLGTSIIPGGAPYTEYWSNDSPDFWGWFYNTEVKDSGCVSGDCVDGYGTYVYTDGTYSGTFSYGMRNGFGTYTFNNGAKLTATWADDQVDGFGKLRYTDGWFYIGEYSYDMQDGYGLEYGIDGFVSGTWSWGVLLNDDSDSTGFGFAARSTKNESKLDVGGIKPKMGAGSSTCLWGSCTDGYGTMMYDNLDMYTGYFKGGFRDGYGNYSWAGGTKYEGTWSGGNLDGIGKIIFADGSYFIGEFRKGLRDGYGVEVSQGTFNAGLWEFGKFQEGKTTLGFTEFQKKKGTGGFDLKKNTASSPAAQKTMKAIAAKTVKVNE